VATLAAQASGDNPTSTSIGVRVGSLGIGAEVSRLLNDNLGLRVGAGYFSLSRSVDQEDVTYEATVKWQAVTGLLDWYPGKRRAFHLSAGVMTNPLKFSGTGLPTGGSITLNGVDYTTSQVGVLTASIEYASALPYVGLGFGTPASRNGGLGFIFDIGAGIGKATVALNSTNSASNAALRADLNAELATLQDDVNKVPIWPVVSLGLSYRF
jgi:hypothetical protein